MLALSWSYCAVPSLGNGGAPSCEAYWALACAQIWSNCSCVTTASPTVAMAPAGTAVAAAGGEHERRRQQAEQDRSHDDFLHRLSLPGIEDGS